MNTTTKYILWAAAGIAGIFIIIYIISQAKKMQAAKRMREQEAAAAEAIENNTIIKGNPDWNNSKVKIDITFGSYTWYGELNPTTNITQQQGDKKIILKGGATQGKIQLLKNGKIVKEATADFYDEKLIGFN